MITLNNVSKELSRNIILKDISLKLKKGNIYLIRGHNGCGKTMLLRLLCGLIKETTGTIEKEDYSYGVMIEQPSFCEYETGRSNLKFLASIQKIITAKEINDNLEKVNLLDVADTKVAKYSLGMKQRLAFCQAIMENPDVLLLDEPFNALDDTNYDCVVNILRDMKKQDKLIVVAAHGIQQECLPLFDEIIGMSAGGIKSVTSA